MGLIRSSGGSSGGTVIGWGMWTGEGEATGVGSPGYEDFELTLEDPEPAKQTDTDLVKVIRQVNRFLWDDRSIFEGEYFDLGVPIALADANAQAAIWPCR